MFTVSQHKNVLILLGQIHLNKFIPKFDSMHIIPHFVWSSTLEGIVNILLLTYVGLFSLCQFCVSKKFCPWRCCLPSKTLLLKVCSSLQVAACYDIRISFAISLEMDKKKGYLSDRSAHNKNFHMVPT